jgi:hypothetical protein
MANIGDHQPFVNVESCGSCQSLLFPPTAEATAANSGELTPMPCMPEVPYKWSGGKNDYIVKGAPALLKSSTCQCIYGGTISLITDGQRNTGPADMSRISIDEFEKDQISAEGLDPDSVLDGIQMALDAAGMVPLAGAVPDLLNAAISACRGNWLDAGISLLAAVPGAGDVVGGAKIAKDGVKLAKATQKTAKGSEKVILVAEKRAAKVEEQIAQSDKVLKFPGSTKQVSNSVSGKSVQNNNSVARINDYKVEKKKQVNGADISTITKVPDNEVVTIKNSANSDGVNSSPSGFDNSYNVNSIRSTSSTGSSTSKQGSPEWSQKSQGGKPVEKEGGDNVLKFSEKKPTKEGDAKKIDFNS